MVTFSSAGWSPLSASTSFFFILTTFLFKRSIRSEVIWNDFGIFGSHSPFKTYDAKDGAHKKILAIPVKISEVVGFIWGTRTMPIIPSCDILSFLSWDITDQR